MGKIIILFGVVFLTCNTYVNCQTTQNSDSVSSFVKATYLEDDITKLLAQKTKYPIEALKNKIQGDVIVSFVVNKNGKLDKLAIVSSPDLSISTSSIIVLNTLEKEWSPTVINKTPIDKNYLIIFRYRMYMEFKPSSLKSKAEKYYKKEKYEKALTFYNKAIKDNQYDFQLFESRSRIRKMIGDIEGSKQDYSTSTTLKNEIMAVIEIDAIGKTRTTKTITKF